VGWFPQPMGATMMSITMLKCLIGGMRMSLPENLGFDDEHTRGKSLLQVKESRSRMMDFPDVSQAAVNLLHEKKPLSLRMGDDRTVGVINQGRILRPTMVT
jgi:hypothetical protein